MCRSVKVRPTHLLNYSTTANQRIIIMENKSALEIYTTERLNCAQSILKGHQNDFSVSEKMIIDFKAFGGGRAENNMCGALYAAVQLARNEEARNHIISGFKEQTESTKCSKIRKAGKITCKECVRIASELLSSTLQNA